MRTWEVREWKTEPLQWAIGYMHDTTGGRVFHPAIISRYQISDDLAHFILTACNLLEHSRFHGKDDICPPCAGYASAQSAVKNLRAEG
mgnify:FL=1